MEGSDRTLGTQLEQLSEKLLRLGGLVEQAIGRTAAALTQRDSVLAREVIRDDARIDSLELEIDEACMELLALQQPLAGDLRFIATAMKITPDLERIADHAVNIAERVVELNEEAPLNAGIDLPQMAARAQQMVRGALDALVRHDGEAAREVIKMDDELDGRMDQVFRVLVSFMLEAPNTITRALRLAFIAKHFERIGDQATNICEQIVYMTEARVIKHTRFGAEGANAAE